MTRADARIYLAMGRALALACACSVAAPAALASISGVCPDGSMFIVQRAESVPCRDAKAVAPGDLPPMKPEYLPRPYGWESFHRRNDPNNPYNLIQEPLPEPTTPPQRSEPERIDSHGGGAQPQAHVAPSESAALVHQAAPRERAEARATGSALALMDSEIEDLATIVELSQRSAPASFSDDGHHGQLRLARSLAFEARMREHLAARGQASPGPVVLFAADSESGGAFYGNLTFVQNGIAFHPSKDDPNQIGVIRGGFGPLSAGAGVLGYVVLPERLDPSEPIDVYWNDRQLTATFVP